MKYELLQFFQPEEVLIPLIVISTDPKTLTYYHYFKEIKKPNNIQSIIGIIIKINEIEMLSSSLKQFIEFLQQYNKPLYIQSQTYLYTLFNIQEKDLLKTIQPYITIYNIYMGIYICHPLTPIYEYIKTTLKQFENSQYKHCIYSILNDLY